MSHGTKYCSECKIITEDDKNLINTLLIKLDNMVFSYDHKKICLSLCPSCFPEILTIYDMLCIDCYKQLEKNYKKKIYSFVNFDYVENFEEEEEYHSFNFNNFEEELKERILKILAEIDNNEELYADMPELEYLDNYFVFLRLL